MKKTILAAAITTLFAATAHGATVYEADGTTVGVFGDSEVAIVKGTDKDSSSIIDIQDADFGFELSQEIKSGLALGGLFSFTYDESTNAPALEQSYISVTSANKGTLTIGRQYTLLDDAGIANDYNFGISGASAAAAHGVQVIKYKFDNDMFYAGVAYLKDTSAGTDGDQGFDANIGARFSDVELTAYYSDIEETTALQVEGRYTLDALSLAAAYATTDVDGASTDVLALAVAYQLDDKTTLSAGVSNADADDAELVQYFANAAFAFSSNVNVYVELGGNDGDDSELGYATGMQVSF